MVDKPTEYPIWTDGAPEKVIEPPAPILLSGWTEGQPLPFQYLNWLSWLTNAWIEWLDQSTNPDVLIVTKVASFTVDATAQYYICTPGVANINASLPAATSKAIVCIKNVAYGGSNTVTVVPNGTDKIENANTSVVLSPGSSLYLVCDGAGNWWQIP